MNKASSTHQDASEEWLNAITHGLGFFLAIVVTVIGVTAAAETMSLLRVLTVSVFLLALCFVYLTSTMYHLLKLGAGDRVLRWRRVWHWLDKAAIFLLIAGTYTPVVLIMLPPGWGWPIFGVVWACAAVGLARQVRSRRTASRSGIDTLLYLLMGWVALVAVVPIWRHFPAPAFALLVAGGAFYSLGCPFFLWERLRFNHAIWHLFVLAGSASHVLLVLWHVIPLSA